MVKQDAVPVELTFDASGRSPVIACNNSDGVTLFTLTVSGDADQIKLRTSRSKTLADEWPEDGALAYGAAAGVETHEAFNLAADLFKVTRPSDATVRVWYQRWRRSPAIA
jgi:hypothetical protein